MNKKVILVVLDGLNYQVAKQCLGFLMGHVERGSACLHKLRCELPSLSRPLYETILTGVTPIEHGVVNNNVVRLSNQSSVFTLARRSRKITAAAAYSWISELYNRAPFNPVTDRQITDESQNIQYGLYYWDDHYPDSHLFADAEVLRTRYQPDFLLVHPMNIDAQGHQHGLLANQYRNAAVNSDQLLSLYLPAWLQAGYQVMVTSDHGMNAHCNHGGTTDEEREIPLFLLGDAFHPLLSHDNASAGMLSQLHLCGVICEVLGVADHHKPLPETW